MIISWGCRAPQLHSFMVLRAMYAQLDTRPRVQCETFGLGNNHTLAYPTRSWPLRCYLLELVICGRPRPWAALGIQLIVAESGSFEEGPILGLLLQPEHLFGLSHDLNERCVGGRPRMEGEDCTLLHDVEQARRPFSLFTCAIAVVAQVAPNPTD